jgi:hypothetical protein
MLSKSNGRLGPGRTVSSVTADETMREWIGFAKVGATPAELRLLVLRPLPT